MQTKFKVDIHANGYHLDNLVKMIANHNAGISKIDIDVISGYLLAEKAQKPDTTPGKIFLKTEGANRQTLHVSQDEGRTCYISITECEMHELEDTATAELVNENEMI